MLVTIGTYLSDMKANVDKGYLESHGIKVFLKNETIVGGDNLGGFAGESIELQVHKEKAEEAIKLLGEKVG